MCDHAYISENSFDKTFRVSLLLLSDIFSFIYLSNSQKFKEIISEKIQKDKKKIMQKLYLSYLIYVYNVFQKIHFELNEIFEQINL